MSVDQTEVVDFVHLDPTFDEVLLSISDQLGRDEDEGEHLLLLQEKLNTYLGARRRRPARFRFSAPERQADRDQGIRRVSTQRAGFAVLRPGKGQDGGGRA